MASTLTFTALFTQNGGAPATGLTLAEIDITMYSIDINSGALTAVWNTQNPTAEISGVGMYLRQYTDAQLNAYRYVAMANYTGATTLDTDYVYMAFSAAEVNPSTTVTISNPLAASGDALSLVKGDDYNASDSRQITWSSSGWPDITGATIKFNYWNPKNRGERGSFDMSLGSVGGATQSVYLELTAAQSATLKVGERRLRYEVEATISGRAVTLVSSNSSWISVGDSYD